MADLLTRPIIYLVRGYSKCNIAVGGISTNYRLYGDQVSLAGKQFSNPMTIANVLPNSQIDGTGNALVKTYESHLMLNMIRQVAANAQNSPETSAGPDVLEIWETVIAVTEAAISSNAVTFTLALGAAGITNAFDPPPASDYVFAANGGSPLFSCITLPSVYGVASWNIRWEVGSTWSPFVTIPEGGQVCFDAPAGANAIEFQPYGPSGANIVLPDSLLFLTSFAEAGTFSGTLTASSTVTTAVSPQ